MAKSIEEKTVGLFDILFDPRTGKWVWFFDDRRQFREVSEEEMFSLKFLFEANGVNPFGASYVLTDGGFEPVWCKSN